MGLLSPGSAPIVSSEHHSQISFAEEVRLSSVAVLGMEKSVDPCLYIPIYEKFFYRSHLPGQLVPLIADAEQKGK